MISDDIRSGSSRRVIHATCTEHGGTPGFTNLVVSKLDGTIELDPHAVGCLIKLDEQEARTLCAALTEWLGRAACCPCRWTGRKPLSASLPVEESLHFGDLPLLVVDNALRELASLGVLSVAKLGFGHGDSLLATCGELSELAGGAVAVLPQPPNPPHTRSL